MIYQLRTAEIIIKLLFKLGFIHSGFSGDGSRLYSRFIGEYEYIVNVADWIGLLHPYNGRRNPIIRVVAIYHSWSDGDDWRKFTTRQPQFFLGLLNH